MKSDAINSSKASLNLNNRYSIQLYTRDGWEVIPNTRVDFPKYERVSCMKYMQLSGEQIGEQSKG